MNKPATLYTRVIAPALLSVALVIATVPGSVHAQGNSEGQGGERRGGPDLTAAAEKLGVSEDELRAALGGPPPDFQNAATTLGVTEDALKEAIGAPPPRRQ